MPNKDENLKKEVQTPETDTKQEVRLGGWFFLGTFALGMLLIYLVYLIPYPDLQKVLRWFLIGPYFLIWINLLSQESTEIEKEKNKGKDMEFEEWKDKWFPK